MGIKAKELRALLGFYKHMTRRIRIGNPLGEILKAVSSIVQGDSWSMAILNSFMTVLFGVLDGLDVEMIRTGGEVPEREAIELGAADLPDGRRGHGAELLIETRLLCEPS